MRAVFERDGEVIAWWATPVECVSAATRLEREGRLDADGLDGVLRRLDGLADGWAEIEPSERVRSGARRLLRVHGLRAADALQLAAAHVAAEAHTASLPFVTLDRRLAEVARREGFSVEP